MKRSLISLICSSSMVAAEPRAPLAIQLNEYAIHSIPISTEMDTLLMFPEDVTLILGHGLTRGKQPGKVYCQQAENSKLIILRQLEKNSTIVMKAVVNEKAYVFQLSSSDKPATVIHFSTADHTPPAIELTAADLTKTKRTVTDERLDELIRLTKESAFLKPRLPHEYEGFSSMRVSMTSVLQEDVTAEIIGISRFSKEDTFVFLGRIQNTGTKTIQLDDILRIKIGDERLYTLSKLDLSTKTLKPGEQAAFTAALIGDGNGTPMRISIHNRFALQSNK